MVIRKWGWGAPSFSPRTDRMALGPETMGPGRSQVLGPGQEKDELRINTDPPVGLNLSCREVGQDRRPGVSNLRPMGRMQPRMAVNVAQHKIVNLLKT